MEEGEVLPLDGLVPLPLNRNGQADADRMRVENIGDVEKNGHYGKKQKGEDRQQPEIAVDEEFHAVCRHSVDNDRKTPDDRKVDGFDGHRGQRHGNDDAPKHRDEMHENCHRSLGGHRPVGDVERPDQGFEGTVNRI